MKVAKVFLSLVSVLYLGLAASPALAQGDNISNLFLNNDGPGHGPGHGGPGHGGPGGPGGPGNHGPDHGFPGGPGGPGNHGPDHGFPGGPGGPGNHGPHGGNNPPPPNFPPQYPPQNPPQYPPQGGYAYIQSNTNVCYANGQALCTIQLNWSTGLQYGAVVTVISQNEGIEKVFSCSDNTYGIAPWIAPADTYTFRLYASNNCANNVGSFTAPVAIVQVQGAP